MFLIFLSIVANLSRVLLLVVFHQIKYSCDLVSVNARLLVFEMHILAICILSDAATLWLHVADINPRLQKYLSVWIELDISIGNVIFNISVHALIGITVLAVVVLVIFIILPFLFRSRAYQNLMQHGSDVLFVILSEPTLLFHPINTSCFLEMLNQRFSRRVFHI